jgi:hypothetical protein
MIYNLRSDKKNGICQVFNDIVFSYLRKNNILFKSDSISKRLFKKYLKSDTLEYTIDTYKLGIASSAKVILKAGTDYIEEIGERVCTLSIFIEDTKYSRTTLTLLGILYRINSDIYTDSREEVITNSKTRLDRFVKNNIHNTYISNIDPNKISQKTMNYLLSKIDSSMSTLGRSLDFSIKNIYFRHSIHKCDRTMVVVIKNSDNLGTEAITFT